MFIVLNFIAIQVRPLTPSVSCSSEDLGDVFDPFISSTAIKRPRVDNISTDEIKEELEIKEESSEFDSTC